MVLEVFVTAVEIRRLLDEFVPIRIHMTPTDEDRRWVQFDALDQVELVPERGVRVQSSGRVCYEIAGMKPKFAIRTVQVMLEPKIVHAPGPLDTSVEFVIDIEESDLNLVPAMVDTAIMRKVNTALTPQNTGMLWAFSKSLSHAFNLPSRLEPLDQFRTTVLKSEVSVEEAGIRFRVALSTRLTRERPRPTDGGAQPRAERAGSIPLDR
jgi:hypothetical protein